MDLKDIFQCPNTFRLKILLRQQGGIKFGEPKLSFWPKHHAIFFFTKIMKTFQKKWRQKALQTYIFLDDILIVAPTPTLLQKQLNHVMDDLLEAGIKLNIKKQISTKTVGRAFGFQINFQQKRYK